MIQRGLWCTVLFSLAASAAMADEPCTDLYPRIDEILPCLSELIESRQTDLRTTLERLVAAEDVEGRKMLKTSQDAWLAYREKECELEGDAMRGGRLGLVVAGECELRKTEQRIQELNQHLGMMAH